ncbi:hypothetical protein NQ318_000915 [Aromia moschata]|uniref:Uncharacterized protein n=1 Tax=Aromia moschata TaxID=1265417 RepID=A0AAV8ZDI9_9CUCU|nr:hypothetical protein NQ318_000915 [Aromia moschata]
MYKKNLYTGLHIAKKCVTNNSADNPFLYYGAAGGQVFAFLLAISFLLIYYKLCHPSLANRSKIPNLDSDCLESDKPGFSKSYNVRDLFRDYIFVHPLLLIDSKIMSTFSDNPLG